MKYEPQFIITNKILNSVADAQSAKEIINNAPLVPAWERSFQNQALIRSVHHSTAIEGNALNISETEKIISGDTVNTYRSRDILEIVNYRKVMDYISSTGKKILDKEMLMQIHLLLGNNVLNQEYLGHFRAQNAIVINSKTGEIVFDAVDPEDIDEEILAILDWDKNLDDVHPLLRAGILHFELVRIHPFVDLNGRTARIISTWSLYRDGYDFRKFFSLEEYYDQNLQKYYDALDSAHSGDLTNWLEYFCFGVAEELVRIKEKVLALSMDRRLRLRVGQVALNDRQIKIIDHLENFDELKNPDFDSLFPDISDDTILRDLNDLIGKKIVKKKGKTRGAKYILA